MVTLAAAIILLSVLLAACTAEGLSNVYLLSFTYTGASAPTNDSSQINTNYAAAIQSLVTGGNVTTNGLEIRVGYFGFCLISGGGSALLPVICSRSLDTLADVVRSGHASTDPLNLLWAARSFHDATIFSGLIFISIIFAAAGMVLLSTFPGWYEEEVSDGGSTREVKPFPSRAVSNAILILTTISALFCLISALWQHLSAAAALAMASAFTTGFAAGHVGAAAMVFGWLGTGLIMLVAIGMAIMILSIRLLERLTDDPEESANERVVMD